MEASQREEFFYSKLGDIEEPVTPFGILEVPANHGRLLTARQEVDKQLAYRVHLQAERFRVGAPTLFHAALGLVVAYTAGRGDVAFGCLLTDFRNQTVQPRRIPEPLAPILPVRLRIQDATAVGLVEHTQRELTELLNHGQASPALAQGRSNLAGSTSLFSTLMSYRHNAPVREESWSGTSGVDVPSGQERAPYPIVVSVDEQDEGFAVTAQTDHRIDAWRMVQYVCTAMQSLAEALELAPLTPALSLSILPESERRQVLERFNATHSSYPREKLIHELFEGQVQGTPDAVAVVYDSHSLTYAQLNAKANQLAWYLRERQIGPDQLVGICVERGLEMVTGLLGISKAGGAYVPLDPSYPPERLQYILSDAAPKVVLTQGHLRQHLPTNDAEVIALDEQWSQIARQSCNNLDVRALGLSSHHLAYVIYTSGSTGQPKGVMIEHRHVLNLWQGLESPYRQSACERVALNASLNFDASVQQLIQLLSGRTLFVIPEKYRRAPPALLRFFSENQIHAVDCTPSQLKTWISAGLREADECSLRLVLVGGEPIDSELWDSLAKYVGTDFYNVYGPTECTVDSTIALLKSDTTEPHIGHPMENRRIYLLDHHHRPAPIGVTGEIYIGGAGVARGYLNRPELTAERFIKDPFSTDPGARLYKTGDLGRWRADGNIEYLGRNDDQVKIRGYRIELGEIEAQLLQHPQAKEAVVLARKDVLGEKRLVAYVVWRDPSTTGNALGVDALRAHLKLVLPDYMLPSAFVVLESLPLTANGKLDRRALPAPQSTPGDMAAYIAPRTRIEHTLADLWIQVLGVNRVGVHDSFLELGGNSFHVMKMITKVAAELKVDLSVVDLLQLPTIEQLAKLIELKQSSDTASAATDELDYEQGVV
jgi:amino acid adenylation domain-containing protein